MRLRTAVGGLAIAASIAGAGCSDGGGSVEAFCEQVRLVPNFRSIFDSYDASDPAAAAAQLDDAVAKLQALEDASPGDIRDDVHTVADVAAKLVDALGEIDPNDPLAGLQGLDDIQADLDEVEAASTNVAAYAKDQCGIDLAPPAADSTTSTPTSAP